MATRNSAKAGSPGKRRTSKPSSSSNHVTRNPNAQRRKGGRTGYEEVWGSFIEQVEGELAKASELPDDLRKAPYYAPPNVVKRAVYTFVRDARRKLKPGPLEDTIDASRVAHAGSKTLRTLRKDFRKEPYYWVLTGLHLDCPAAKLRKSDVTRFAQHLNYAHRHKVPPEFLIGFLLQSGSLADIYQRALDRDRREKWFIDKTNL